jgi:alkanesulfonate monooxygenase SsuD/methylene tetrahydromethanopterin reductase-like flavin-dependent oxidoreductase (luciferase family)
VSRPRPEFWLYLPQMRMEVEAIVARARSAEAAGFTGVAFMDHLAPPLAEASPMFEAMTVATWVGAKTSVLRIGHLVLCDPMRHPAVLAKQAVTLDHATGSRFELGIGYGSVVSELVGFGVTRDDSAGRAERLAESLELMRAFWSGQAVEHHGRHFNVSAAAQQPSPLSPIPILVGGAGRRALAIVKRYADWWNVPLYALDRLETLRPLAGEARLSTQHLIGWVDSPARREEVTAVTERRFGGLRGGATVGDAGELSAMFAVLEEQGVERFYVWLSDFAPIASIASFGEQVIRPAVD